LLGVVFVVLGGFTAFLIFLARRAAASRPPRILKRPNPLTLYDGTIWITASCLRTRSRC
jgi:hypothetical protein